MSWWGKTVAAGCVAATVTACGEPGPAIEFTHGTLIEDHQAMDAFGCGADERTLSSLAGTTVLSPAQHSVSRRLVAGVALSRFDLDVTPVVSGDRSGALTLTASAHVEDNRCGTGCEGAGARARFSWSGAVSLPPAAQGYAVHLDVQAERATSSGPSRFAEGECAVEVPWRPVVVVEAGDATRDFDAPAGDAIIRVTCARLTERSFATIGCFGAIHSGSPEAQGYDSTVTVSLRVRMEFAPRVERDRAAAPQRREPTLVEALAVAGRRPEPVGGDVRLQRDEICVAVAVEVTQGDGVAEGRVGQDARSAGRGGGVGREQTCRRAWARGPVPATRARPRRPRWDRATPGR